jgi:hypothetical protein
VQAVQNDSRLGQELRSEALTESLQPPESSIDIDMAGIVVEATAEVLVGITILIVADGVGIFAAISVFILKVSNGSTRGFGGLVEHSQDTLTSGWIVEGATSYSVP